jgi:transposase
MANGEHLRKPYPSDVSDEEWSFVAPYLTLVRVDAPQRRHDLREVFNAVRWVAHTGAPWRWLPHDLPPWDIVYRQTRRGLEAGAFEALVHDLRLLLRLAAGRAGQPSAAILGSRTLQSTPESGARAGDDGHKRRKRRKRRKGLEGPRRCRHAGPLAGAGRHARRRTGPHPGRGPG